jgi:hypothetical protein
MEFDPLYEDALPQISALDIVRQLHRHAVHIGRLYLEIARRGGNVGADTPPEICEWVRRTIDHHKAVARPEGCCDDVPTIEQIAELIERHTKRPPQ